MVIVMMTSKTIPFIRIMLLNQWLVIITCSFCNVGSFMQLKCRLEMAKAARCWLELAAPLGSLQKDLTRLNMRGKRNPTLISEHSKDLTFFLIVFVNSGFHGSAFSGH